MWIRCADNSLMNMDFVSSLWITSPSVVTSDGETISDTFPGSIRADVQTARTVIEVSIVKSLDIAVLKRVYSQIIAAIDLGYNLIEPNYEEQEGGSNCLT